MRGTWWLSVIVVVGMGGLAQAKPAARVPAAVLGAIERGPSGARDGLADYANAVNPGTGIAVSDMVVSNLLAKAVGAPSIEGFDHAQPEYLVWVDDGKVRGAALVGTIADDTTLTTEAAGLAIARDRGHAVIGAPPVVALVGAWALGSLATQPGLGRPSATLYVGNLLARYHDELATARSKLTVGSLLNNNSGTAAGLQSAMVAIFTAVFDGALSIAADTDRVIVTFDADASVASVDVALVPRAGSRLARFVAAQQANDFALLGKLPAGPAAAIMAGAFHGGPYRKTIGVVMAALYAGGDADALVAPTLELMQAASGEFAAETRLTATGMQNIQLMGVATPAAASRAYQHMMAAMAAPLSMSMMGLKATLHASPQPLAYDGLAIGSFETAIDQTGLTAAQKVGMNKTMPGGRAMTYAGLVDRFGITVAGTGTDEAMVKTLVDTARGRTVGLALTPDQLDLVAAARARHDSAVMIFDFNLMRGIAARPGTTLPVAPMSMTTGFADHRAHVRMAMPVATFKVAAGIP